MKTIFFDHCHERNVHNKVNIDLKSGIFRRHRIIFSIYSIANSDVLKCHLFVVDFATNKTEKWFSLRPRGKIPNQKFARLFKTAKLFKTARLQHFTRLQHFVKTLNTFITVQYNEIPSKIRIVMQNVAFQYKNYAFWCKMTCFDS